jgi:tRNA uridine 5-carboxymethylaminomethyl modification enzyme
MEKVIEKRKETESLVDLLGTIKFLPEEINTFLAGKGSAEITQKTKAIQILLRPLINLKELIEAATVYKKHFEGFSESALEQAEIQVKYAVYLEKEEEMVLKMSELENQIIPDSFKYENISSLSNEARQKFIKIKPRTLGQASRISGVNPSDVQILMVFMGR